MSPSSTRIRRGALIGCGLAILLWCAAAAAQTPTPASEASPAEPAAPDDPLTAALAIIEQYYRKPVSREQLVAGALEGMVRELDPYSEYLDENEWREFHSSLRAEFAGIGTQLAMDAAGVRPVIAQPLLGSPAKAAGLRAGDLLLAVDGQSTEGLGIDRVRQLLRGAAGTPVELSVLHAGSAAPISVTIVRRIIKTPSVRGIRRDAKGNDEYRLDERRGIGYLHVVHMTSDTLPALEEVLRRLARSGLAGLVLDLRECVGGYLEAGVGVADLFLDRGRILTVTSRSAAPRTYDAQPGVATRVPLAVLINQETASACEILAAALQDHERAALVGQRTFGKGYVGNLFSLGEHQGGLKITVASFQRPSGTTLDRHEAPAGSTDPGIAPDPGLEVVVEGEEYDAWFADFILLDLPVAPANGPAKDRPLDRAVAVLIERMGAVAGGAD